MSWIKIISYEEANGKLKKLYDRIKGPQNYIDNIMLVHSLRPNTLEGHMYVYKNSLHHSNNTFAMWFLEAIGVYVSSINNCDYCVKHHSKGIRNNLDDSTRASMIISALIKDSLEGNFSRKELQVFQYAKKLTLTPGKIDKAEIEKMKEHGISDGELLEVNQVVSYFCYANRTVLGLGVNTENEIIGLSPKIDSQNDNWHHS